MTEELRQLTESGFKRVLIIGSVLKYRRSLAVALIKLLSKPAFSALDPVKDGLPDKQYAWSSVDLLCVDMSEHKSQIRNWFFDIAGLDQMPPVIFLDNRATVDDAGDMVRAGAADYLDLTTLNTRRLSRAILMAASLRQTTTLAKDNNSEHEIFVDDVLATQLMMIPDEDDLRSAESGMTDEPTEVLPTLTPKLMAAMQDDDVPAKAVQDEEAFLTTGLMDIYKRGSAQSSANEEVLTEPDSSVNASKQSFLTTGLMSILERGKVLGEDIPQSPPPQAAAFSVGNRLSVAAGQMEKGNEIIGHYRLLEFIAIGGSASVYKAQHTAGGEILALKLFDNDNGDKRGEERFLRGYRLIEQVKHPQIVAIKESGVSDGRAYVVMEYFPGGELKALLRQGVSRQLAVRYTVEIAEALNAAHAQKILHRDLKPSNVLMREDGSLALLDFGIAKLMAEGQSVLTQSNHVVGTSHYISPEQAMGGKIDGRSDLYALGVMLYEMLEGRRPYLGNSPVHIMQQHVRGPIPVLASVDDPLNAIIGRLMAKDPDDRYASGAEVVKALGDTVPGLLPQSLLKEASI